MPKTGSFYAALLMGAAVPGWAQTLPDAGSLRQQIEREQAQPKLPQRAAPELAPATEADKSKGGLRVDVKRFVFSGNKRLDEATLQAAVAPWAGRSLNHAELERAAAAAGEAYRSRGWIVRSFLPRQDITGGEVRIEIVEARMGRVTVDGAGSGRVSPAQVQATAEARLKAGEAVNSADLDRGLLLADDLPGVTVTGRLMAGRTPGETDLALKMVDEPRLTGQASLDNYGARSTGAARASLQLDAPSPFGIGDLASGMLVHTQGSDFLRGEYSAPVGADGLRLGASAGTFRYKLSSAFSELGARGRSNSFGLYASYPAIRSRNMNLYLRAAFDQRNFRNEAAGAVTSDYKVSDLTLSANLNAFDDIGGGGANAASVSLIGAKVNLAGSPSEAADTAGPKAAGSSVKLRYSLSRQQALAPNFALFGSLSGQIANKNQDSSERFYLGGPYGVRAYPADEGSGSSGMLANLELRARLPANFSGSAFVDWGQVKVNAKPYDAFTQRNSYSLKGAGLSLAWQGSDAVSGLIVRATWARRIGSNPNPTVAGRDQDGSLVRNRFWLSATLPF